MTTVVEYGIALPLGLVAILGFIYLARHFTYRAFYGVSPNEVDEDVEGRTRGWIFSIVLGAPVLFGLCAAAVALGRYLLGILFD